jgi:hypothetical protein
MNKKFNILNEQINRVEKRLLKLESQKTAKEELMTILNSGYTSADLKRLSDEIESDEKDAVFKEIVKELNTHNDACNYYKSLSNGNLFKCDELDKDLLDVINNLT